ncbi:MAG: aldolase [Clostridia bacterium]|nr:aldolase [Clostridia bacterium]
MPLKLMYITNNPQVALIAEKYGVDRIWIDLETLGKEERQKNINSVKSHHSISDIKNIAPLLSTAEMLVRVNPWNENSEEEIYRVINSGARLVMLPMWKTVGEVEKFIRAVGCRAKTVLLLETKEAVSCLDDVLKIKGIDEIHIGLNDLHLSYGLTFMFELLTDGTVESICKKIKQAGILYGFGGIAKIGQGLLPAEKIILEHYRLGSTRAILSRSFCNTELTETIEEVESTFKENMKKLRDFENIADKAALHELEENRKAVQDCVNTIVENIRTGNRNG